MRRLVHSNPDPGSHVADVDKVVLRFFRKARAGLQRR